MEKIRLQRSQLTARADRYGRAWSSVVWRLKAGDSPGHGVTERAGGKPGALPRAQCRRDRCCDPITVGATIGNAIGLRRFRDNLDKLLAFFRQREHHARRQLLARSTGRAAAAIDNGHCSESTGVEQLSAAAVIMLSWTAAVLRSLV
jgi:hypothetical protein